MLTNQQKLNPLPAGFVPNKALGQNFLSNESIIEAILDGAQIVNKRVLEIGPGTGALTGMLIERASFLAAVELDARLCALLTERYGERLTILHADVLDADIPALMGDNPWHAVGNLPYYATTPIVLRLLSLLPQSMTLMVQKEAADRFFAGAKGRVYGPVAVMTGCCYDAEVVVNAPRSCFTPPPEVDSVVVRLARNEQVVSSGASFLAFLKQAFSMRRKTLYNNLGKDERVPATLAAQGYPADARAEALPPEALLQIFMALS
ncbi:MAG: 16S rRNA (adenine(1518)-N(6)/adenine(1519)-N(6))-dimethyltransferase RsmA [Eubacteriales bacterium]|jgi:16S rRNA (adenine1518-N6/adenine1519-N6)-dimethyltransferase|nr:16S rRNA (adenine(1518)-N(6)/adenine(1519)-N(6))-dimethyltransferase RsmA [Eubacteriales bacterium]